MPAQEENGTLAAGFAAHERSAFGEAYRRYAGLLYSAAYAVLKNAEDTEDCIADTIAKLWRTPGAYSLSRGNLRSFLVVCVRNEAISRRRRDGRTVRLVERLAAFPVEHDALPIVDPVEREKVRQALLALPDQQRIALELAYYQEKTHTQIAAELQQPLGTIKSRIRHGLRNIGFALASGERIVNGQS